MLRRSLGEIIQNERTRSMSPSSTGTSSLDCCATKQGRIASAWPARAAWYWAITLVLRNARSESGATLSM